MSPARRGRPRARPLAGVVCAGLLALAGSGCVYSKQVTNEQVRSLETSRIVVGETTVLDVLSAWGPPAPIDSFGLLNPPSRGLFQPDAGAFRYVSRELSCTSLLATGPIPNAPVMMAPRLPFVWCDDQPTHVVLLEFDRAGVVKRISKGSTEVVWRPWSGGGDRRAEVATTAVRGTSLP